MSVPMLALLSDPQRSKLIKQGAEAKVYVVTLFPAPVVTSLPGKNQAKPVEQPNLGHTEALLKYRFPKTYRHHTLSTQLTASRTTAEARALVRCAKAGVNTPGILCLDEAQGILGLEIIQGNSVRELLGGGAEGDEFEEGKDDPEEIQKEETAVVEEKVALEMMKLIGEQLAKMHQAHVIHGDLTTSNMMVRQKSGLHMEIVLIDFGLSNNSTLAEDKAVDLYVLERAFQSTHPASDELFNQILASYKDTLETKGGASLGKDKFAMEKSDDNGKGQRSSGPTNWIEIHRRLEDGEYYSDCEEGRGQWWGKFASMSQHTRSSTAPIIGIEGLLLENGKTPH